MKPAENYSLITGASMGLGKELAIESARRGHNVILAALPGRNLQQLCGELEHAFGIKAVARECDLTNESELNGLAREILEGYAVDRLINNAGVGGTVRFEDSSPEYLDRIIHLNIRATTMLTRLMLPELMRHRSAWVINIASVAAFGPLPFKTIYPASKAFIYSFSRSLNQELKGTGVRVMVVTPGPIITNPDAALRIIHQGALGRIGLLSAGKISRLILNGADEGKEVIVPGFMNRFNRFLLKWIPENFRLSMMDKVIRKELAENVSLYK